MPIPTIATISGRPVALKIARLDRRSRPELAEPEQGGRAADDHEEREEERREPEPGRRQEAVEVEVHPGDDEVDRDQEPEPDSLEPHSHGGGFRGVEGEPHDQPAGERAEHEVEAHLDREEDERREAEDGQPHGGLAGRVHGLLEDADDPGRARPERGRRGEHHDGAEAR